MPPKACDDAKEDRKKRRKEFGPDIEAQQITDKHRLYRCVAERHVDYEINKPRPAAFDGAGMSVYVEGPGFPKLDLQEVLQIKAEWVAIASIDASEFLKNKETYHFELLHDPYGDEDGNQHNNHAIVVCKKNPTKCTKIQQACQWGIHPHKKT